MARVPVQHDVLLINPPIRENRPAHVPPVGLASIAGVLSDLDFEIDVWDLNIQRPDREGIRRTLRSRAGASIVGIGGLITVYKYLTWLIPEVREALPGATIVVGGGVAAQASDLLLQRGLADVVVLGEGELIAAELFPAISEGADIRGIRGIGFMEDGQPYYTEKRQGLADIDTLGKPRWDLFDIEAYMLNRSNIRKIGSRKDFSYLSSRGCPYNCNYCYHIFGRSARYYELDRVIEDLIEIKRIYAPEYISFIDELFVVNRRRVEEFCDRYLEAGIGIPWGCSARVDRVRADTLQRMKQADCQSISFGFESGSQAILDRMNKRVTVAQMDNAIKITRKAQILCLGTFMFGYPGENEETIRETVAFCTRNAMRVGLFYTTPYPGTALYTEFEDKILEQYGSTERFIMELGDAADLVVNMTDFSDEELIRRHDRAVSEIRSIGIRDVVRQVSQVGPRTALKKAMRFGRKKFAGK